MSLLDSYGPDYLVNLAASLSYDLMKAGAGRLRDLALGDAAERALQAAWDLAFRRALQEIIADLDRDSAELTADIFRAFIADEKVAPILIDLALAGRTPSLAELAQRFDDLEFDRATLLVDFNQVLAALTSALAEELLESAMQAESPLFNRVNVMRLVAVQQLLQQQQGTLSGLQSQVARLDEQLSSGQDNYNLIFRGPVTGIAIGDRAAARVESDLRPLFEQILAQINRLAAPDQPAPYSEEDRAAYLEAVIQECDTIQLPYAEEGGPATLPLRQIYVALKADRSSPVERKASHQLFKSLVEVEAAEGMGMEEAVIYRIARFDPYAARYLIYDPRLREQLLQDKRAEADRSFDLAEILRRHRWLVLLGDPGSGKSTLARWLSLQLAEALRNKHDVVLVPANHVRPDADAQQQEALGPARLPVLVRLADYAALRWPAPGTDTRLPLRLYLGRHIENLLQPGRQSRAVYALIQDYLAASRVAFILDGLDEITDVSQRQAIKGEIEQLIADWIPNQQERSPLVEGYHQAEAQMADAAEVGGNQIIVTSRIVGYQLNPLHENLPHFIIQPMDDTAVTSFCHNWTAATGIPDQAGALTKAVLEHPNINVREQMARNPLMLTILAQVFRAGPQEGLPDRRSELYRRASTAVFGQRQEQWGQLSQSIGGNDLEPIRKLLNHTKYAHKRTVQRPTNSRFSCTIGCECCVFWPTIQASFPRPNAVLGASAFPELVPAMAHHVAVGGRYVSDN